MSSEPIARLLATVFRAAVDEMHDELSLRGYEELRPAHGFILNLVGDGTTTSELASHLGVTKQGAAKLVASLVAMGFLQKQPHPSDRRATLITVTPHGREALAAAATAQHALEAHWAEILGVDRMRALRSSLERLAEEGRATLRPTW